MKPTSVPNLQLKTVDGKVLVHDPNLEKVHLLNATAGRVLELCDGTRDIDAIASEIGEPPLEAETVRRDVIAIVDDFARLGLVSKR